MEAKHPAVGQIFEFFHYEHLPDHLQAVSAPCKGLAESMVLNLPNDPELTVGLRKLLEARDCFVRVAVRANRDGTEGAELSKS